MGNRWRENKKKLSANRSLVRELSVGQLANRQARPANCRVSGNLPASGEDICVDSGIFTIWWQRSILCINLPVVFPASISPQKVTNYGYVPESLTVTCRITLHMTFCTGTSTATTTTSARCIVHHLDIARAVYSRRMSPSLPVGSQPVQRMQVW